MIAATPSSRLPLVLAAALLLAGCGSGGGDERGDTQPVGGAGASPTEAARVAESSQGPAYTEIPAGLRLPHAGEWQRFRVGDPFPVVCLDPPAELADVDPTDTGGEYDDSTGDLDALAVYADGQTAAEAMDDFRGQLRRCGGRQLTEAGTWMTWHHGVRR